MFNYICLYLLQSDVEKTGHWKKICVDGQKLFFVAGKSVLQQEFSTKFLQIVCSNVCTVHFFHKGVASFYAASFVNQLLGCLASKDGCCY